MIENHLFKINIFWIKLNLLPLIQLFAINPQGLEGALGERGVVASSAFVMPVSLFKYISEHFDLAVSIKL